MVRQRQQDFRRHYTRLNTVGVCLCILAAVPLFTVLAVSPAGQEEYSPWFPASVCALLALVGLGGFALVYGGTCWEAMQSLLEEGDYTRRNKARKQVVEAVSLIYWLVVLQHPDRKLGLFLAGLAGGGHPVRGGRHRSGPGAGRCRKEQAEPPVKS